MLLTVFLGDFVFVAVSVRIMVAGSECEGRRLGNGVVIVLGKS